MEKIRAEKADFINEQLQRINLIVFKFEEQELSDTWYDPVMIPERLYDEFAPIAALVQQLIAIASDAFIRERIEGLIATDQDTTTKLVNFLEETDYLHAVGQRFRGVYDISEYINFVETIDYIIRDTKIDTKRKIYFLHQIQKALGFIAYKIMTGGFKKGAEPDEESEN